MIGKLTNLEAVERWMRSQTPPMPYVSIYHGFQVDQKKPSANCYNNSVEQDLNTVIRNVKTFLLDHSEHGGQFTIFIKPIRSTENSADNKQDTSGGKTEFLELMPQGYYPSSRRGAAVAGVDNSPAYSEVDIENKISGAIGRAKQEWVKDLTIQKLEQRIGELENEEPEGFDWAGALVGLGEMIVSKIPGDSIGRILEGMVKTATPETMDKVANATNTYMAMKMQEQQMRAAAMAANKKTNQSSDEDDENAAYENV